MFRVRTHTEKKACPMPVTTIRPQKLRRSKNTRIPLVATDSEWDPSIRGKWVCTVFVWEDGKTIVYINEDVPDEVKDRLDARAAESNIEVRYVRRDDLTRLLPEGKHRLAIFFSPKDLEFALGWDWLQKAIMNGTIRQRNNITTGRNCDVQVLDLYGWACKSSLKRFLTALGITPSNKDLMDQYKTCMWKGLLDHPEDFLDYVADDARLLLQAYRTFVSHFRRIQQECLGMGEAKLWTQEKIPTTNGSLVARTFERWLYGQAGDYQQALRFCLLKLGLLSRRSSKHHANRVVYRQAVKRYRRPEDLRDADLTAFFGRSTTSPAWTAAVSVGSPAGPPRRRPASTPSSTVAAASTRGPTNMSSAPAWTSTSVAATGQPSAP